MPQQITIHAYVAAPKQKVWDSYTQPQHITQWNFAHPSWHCPTASNTMQVGGTYRARMEARDGSSGFDFEATYTRIEAGESFDYTMPDGRTVAVLLEDEDGATKITVTFDAETENPIEMQRGGWQSILDNFKSYTESM